MYGAQSSQEEAEGAGSIPVVIVILQLVRDCRWHSILRESGDDGGITADCKSVTLETLQVRLLPLSLR